MQANVAMDRYFEMVANEDTDFELSAKTSKQIAPRSKKEQVEIRRKVEEILAEKLLMQSLSEPYR